MKTSSERILTTHVGSLPRPDDLIALLQAKESGKPYDRAAFDRAVRTSVADIVRKQTELGIDVIDDGEESKIGFIAYITERIDGFVAQEGNMSTSSFSGSREFSLYPEYYKSYGMAFVRPTVCRGPLVYQPASLQTDIDNLKAALAATPAAAEAFMPATSPANVERWFKNEYYPSQDDYARAIAEALHVEYKTIVDAGLILQVDDPSLSTYYTRNPNASIDDFLAWGETRVEILNHALRDIPPDRVRYHTCYGINMGPRTTDLEMKHMARLMLKIRAGAYSFEAANPRHEHEWQVWEDVKLPDGKVLIPGVITHTSVLVEHPELVAQRIGRFVDVVGAENVIAGADCGFATHPSEKPEILPQIVWAKFEALVEGARLASARKPVRR
jgi:5-methyltetrahydropteroyltriglutamate--homocysteine methyltransferase